MYTSTLDPSLNGLMTSGNPILDFNLDIYFLFILSLLNINFLNFGVKMLFLINIFFEISLSIAIEEARTPE